ncbi:unnamed protein product, partial [Tetraodon nigroviridis]
GGDGVLEGAEADGAGRRWGRGHGVQPGPADGVPEEAGEPTQSSCAERHTCFP